MAGRCSRLWSEIQVGCYGDVLDVCPRSSVQRRSRDWGIFQFTGYHFPLFISTRVKIIFKKISKWRHLLKQPYRTAIADGWLTFLCLLLCSIINCQLFVALFFNISSSPVEKTNFNLKIASSFSRIMLMYTTAYNLCRFLTIDL